MSLIRLSGVDKSVKLPTGEMLQILHGVDLAIDQGEHVAIIGRSGSGKSTLLNVLGLLDNPSKGEYLLGDQHVGGLSGKQRSDLRGRTFGFVFQQFNLLPRRSAVENACLPLLYSSGETFWKRRALGRQMLEQVGLGDRLDAKPEQLSGGEQQRVAIARALVRQPRIILADEPTGSLDVDTGVVVMDLLERVCAEHGATLITITHDLAVAGRAERRYRLDHGVITEEDRIAPLSEETPPGEVHDTRPIEIVRLPAADTAVLPPVVEEPPTEQFPPPAPAARHARTFPAPSGPPVAPPDAEPPAAPQDVPAAPEPSGPPAAAGDRQVNLTKRRLRRRRILPAHIKRPEEPAAGQDRPPLDEELYRMGGEQP